MARLLISIAFFAAFFLGSTAQTPEHRSEFIPFDTRDDALNGRKSGIEHYIEFNPQVRSSEGDIEVLGQEVDIPVKWTDYVIFLRIANPERAYALYINGQNVFSCEDAHTPVEYRISRYLVQGRNDIVLLARPSMFQSLESGTPAAATARFAGSCIFAQYKTHIHDYGYGMTVDEKGVHRLCIDVQIENNFVSDEKVTLGYDIYGPDGKILDYGVRESTVPGNATATEQVTCPIGDYGKKTWSAASPRLFRITLFMKRDGKPREYIVFWAGLGETVTSDGNILRNGQRIELRTTPYTASTYAAATADIARLRKEGYTSVVTPFPQPDWFYRVCDAKGMYVFEGAAINPTDDARTIENGTEPSNDPANLGQYLFRLENMYYRTRNHACIIGYVLQGEKASNGYNAYKAYEWMKEREKNRAIVCTTADGDWNTDIERLP